MTDQKQLIEIEVRASNSFWGISHLDWLRAAALAAVVFWYHFGETGWLWLLSASFVGLGLVSIFLKQIRAFLNKFNGVE